MVVRYFFSIKKHFCYCYFFILFSGGVSVLFLKVSSYLFVWLMCVVGFVYSLHHVSRMVGGYCLLV